MSLLPIFLKLTSRRCVVIGAGKIAAEKIQSLLQSEADVHVIAPQALPEIQSLAAEGESPGSVASLHLRMWKAPFLSSPQPARPPSIITSIRRRSPSNILCNAVDDPPNCDFYFGSVVRRGDLQVAISTAGESPALAQRLRREIDEQLPHDLGPWLASLGSLRRDVLAAYYPGEERKILLHQLAQRDVCDSASCPSRQLALAREHAEVAR